MPTNFVDNDGIIETTGLSVGTINEYPCKYKFNWDDLKTQLQMIIETLPTGKVFHFAPLTEYSFEGEAATDYDDCEAKIEAMFHPRGTGGGGEDSTSSFTPNLYIYINTPTPTGILATKELFQEALRADGPGDNNDSTVVQQFFIFDTFPYLVAISVSNMSVIPTGMFENNTEIQGFIDLGGLLSIGGEIRENAFRGSTLQYFQSVNFGFSANVGDYAFADCENLNSVRLPLWNAAGSSTTIFDGSDDINDLVVLRSEASDSVDFIGQANGFNPTIIGNQIDTIEVEGSVFTAGNFVTTTNGNGINMASPDGTLWQVRVDNTGALVVTLD